MNRSLNQIFLTFFLTFIFSVASNSQTPDVALIPLTTNLESPTCIANAGDGSQRLFITEQQGMVMIFDGDSLLTTPFLDIRDEVSCCNERGLLGIAFHPDYANNGFFYVNYTDNNGDTVVARYVLTSNSNVADQDSELIILTIDQPAGNHNGGYLAFGPDNFLYISSRDAGGNPGNRAQETDNLLGKILRIDIDGDDFPDDSERNYSIPSDNPFQNEIWVLGLRNPWRFSFDSVGNLFIGDVGQNTNEEIDFQSASSSAGENYGWQCFEGSDVFDSNSDNCPQNNNFVFPILEYTQNPGGHCSVTGGFRYRGEETPELINKYVYGDFCSGVIWIGTEENAGMWTSSELLNTNFLISSFGEDERNELYLADLSGGLYKFTNNEVENNPDDEAEEDNNDPPEMEPVDDQMPDNEDDMSEDIPIDDGEDEVDDNDDEGTEDNQDEEDMISENNGSSCSIAPKGNNTKPFFLLSFFLFLMFVAYKLKKK